MENKQIKNKTFCFGDVHTGYRALKQAIERTPLNKGDTLISLGDLVDGKYDETYELFEYLLELEKNYKLIYIKGNHDDFVYRWIKSGINPDGWKQGGLANLKSWCKQFDKEYTSRFSGYTTNLIPEDLPKAHIKIFSKQLPYYIDDNNYCYVHGGFNRFFTIDDEYNSSRDLMWDRELWKSALSYENMNSETKKNNKFKIKNNFDKIFIGHTTTLLWNKTVPMKAANIWNLDTGAGEYKGKLTIMNVKTEEYYQSDMLRELYPESLPIYF